MGDVNWRGVVDTLRASAPPPRQDQDIASWHHSTAAHSLADAIEANLIPEVDDDADYREIFGKNPDRWRVPLGALLLTLADETAPPWQLARARDEAEELKRVLNEMVGAPLPPRRMGEAGS